MRENEFDSALTSAPVFHLTDMSIESPVNGAQSAALNLSTALSPFAVAEFYPDGAAPADLRVHVKRLALERQRSRGASVIDCWSLASNRFR